MSTNSRYFVLRNYPDDDARVNPLKYSKALSFSPDIIPLYGAKAEQGTLTSDASWRGFTGMPVVGGDVNNVYIRGHGSGGPYAASLRAIPSELILWPQVWVNKPPVSSGPVAIQGGDKPDRYASSDPFQFRPAHVTGSAHSLIANVFKLNVGHESKSLQEFESIPSFDLENFDADKLVSFLAEDGNFTFYNVIVADPTLKHVSATTRLRMFSKLPVLVSFSLDWHTSRIPPGLEVSLVDDRGEIRVPRRALSSLGEFEVPIDGFYDGVLTLNVFSPAGSPHFEPFTGLSLKVYYRGTLRLPLLADKPQLSVTPAKHQLLGALNVIFDPHSTRNLRFASPSATQLRESKNCTGDDGCKCPEKEDCSAIPVTTPAATGWWFRAHLGDTNNFPHGPSWGYSPDVQPIGTDSDLTAPGLWKALLDPNADYSQDNSVELVGNTNNYVFVRGHSTLADIDVQTRLFAIDTNLFLHPSQWVSQTLPGQALGGGGTVEQQSISVAGSNQFYLFPVPFDFKTPPNPNPSNSGDPNDWRGRPHYCIFAEVRQKRKCGLVYPTWPSQQGEDFTTVQDFQNWILSCPLVCARNVNWEPCKPEGNCWTWSCSTPLAFPDCTFPCDFWTIIVECDNPIIPPGSSWTLTCNDNSVFPNGLCFASRPISTRSPAHAGCHFTGAVPRDEPRMLTLTVTWRDGGLKIPPPRVTFKVATAEVAALSPVKHLARQAPEGSEAWPFYVGEKYPYIGGDVNPSPLPTFKQSGLNNWTYEGSPHFVLGQTTITAKPE